MAKRLYIAFIFLAAVSNVSCSEKPLSPATISLLHEALDAFNIPRQSITLKAAKICAARPILKTLYSAPGEFNELNTYVAYHEAAHLADPELKTPINKCTGALFAGYLAGFSSIVASAAGVAHLFELDTAAPACALGISSGIIVFGLAHLIGMKVGDSLAYSHHVLAEHFANIHACKKLIERKKYLPILVKLHFLKILDYCGIQKTSSDHPPVSQELQVIENNIEQYGISVQYRQPYAQPSLESRLFINNVFHCSYETEFNPLQIYKNFN